MTQQVDGVMHRGVVATPEKRSESHPQARRKLSHANELSLGGLGVSGSPCFSLLGKRSKYTLYQRRLTKSNKG